MKNRFMFFPLFIITFASVMKAGETAAVVAPGNKDQSRFAFTFAAGVGFPKMERLNQSLSYGRATNTSDLNRDFIGQFEYQALLGISIGAGYEFLGGNKSEGLAYDYKVSPRPYEIRFSNMHGTFASLRKNWQVLHKPLGIEISGSAKIGYFWSSYLFNMPEFTVHSDFPGYGGVRPSSTATSSDSRWGAELTGGISWRIKHHFSIGAEGGYRWLKFHNYNPPSYWWIGQTFAIESDFSGPLTRLVITFRP